MRKDTLIKNFNKIFREDPYVIDLCASLGLEMDKVEEVLKNIYLNMFFDTMTEDLGIPIYAKTLGITIDNNLPIEEKRAIIQAKWKSKGKCSEELLQAVANSWKNGEVTVNFENSIIKITFSSIGGVPENLDNLKAAIDKVKPAYLLAEYTFNWLYWNMFESWNLSWDQLESKNLDWDNLEKQITKP